MGLVARGPLLRTTAGLLRLTSEEPWLVPLLAGLSLLAFLFEAGAIYLLLPLIHALTAPTGGAGPDVTGPVGRGLALVGVEAGTGALVSLILAFILLKAVTSLVSQFAFAAANARIGDRLRRQSFATIVRARQDYHDRQEPGALLNTLATETWRLSHGLQAVAALVTNACAVSVFLCAMLLLSWRLTLVTALATLAILAAVAAVTARAKRYGDEAVAANRALAARITEGLSGMRTIRLFGREDHEAERFARASTAVRHAFFRMDAIGAVPLPLMELLFAGLLGLLVVNAGEGQFVLLIVFLALLQRMQPHAAGLMHARTDLLGLGGALDDVRGLMTDPSAEPLATGRLPAPPPAEAIAFDGVTFRYETADEPALNGVSFSVPARKTTALVGPSGAGKSTVLALVCRLTDPQAGAVRIDGRDLRDFDLASWRARLAVVPQDVYLFNASLRENIAYGRDDVADDVIEAAAAAAQAHDFIAALPQGYDTRVGDRGVRFSGGQRQRIALARAIVRDPDLLVLDEATNALDGLSERMVRDAVTEIGRDRTVLIVAHRMASIEHADHVVVLDQGRVVEAGPPAVLAAAGGTFARLRDLERLSA